MSGLLLYRRIILPLAIRQALPAYSNELIAMVKSTSLASIVTLMEISGIAYAIISETYRALEVFLCAGSLYLLINFLLTRAIAALEWWLNPATTACHTMHSSAITVTDLHKRFGALEVLKGVSLNANEGEVISIIGASGSGKSTLLRCIPMLTVPDAGEVAIGGETIRMRIRRRPPRTVRHSAGQPHQRHARLRFSELQSVAAHDGVAERHRNTRARANGARAEAIAEAEAILEKGRAARQARQLSRAAFRWPAATQPPLPAPSPCSRAHCCSTNQPPRSIPSSSAKSCA